MSARNFYGFQFDDGVSTTSCYGDKGECLRIAGKLVAFPSRSERDDWCEGPRVYDCPVPRNVGVFRRSVTTRKLPYGWRVAHADAIGDLNDWEAA